MTQSVPLRVLPPGVAFPEELRGRIVFHPDRQQLEFDGFMSKTDFDRLLFLSNDLPYQRALEELFHKCAFSDRPQGEARTMPWLAIVVALAAVVSVAVLGVRVW